MTISPDTENRQKAAPKPPKGSPVRRGPQKRAAETRELLLEAAIDLFSSLGFEGVSVRTIEAQAGVQRGLVAYHFDTKEALWRQAVDHVFSRMAASNAQTLDVIQDLAQEDRLHSFVANFVRFSAEVPQLNRLMVQEGKMPSWRMDYIIETHVRKILEDARDALGFVVDPHGYYLMVGAGAFVFSVEHECKRLFGVDPLSDEFVTEHARMVANLIVQRSPAQQ